MDLSRPSTHNKTLSSLQVVHVARARWIKKFSSQDPESSQEAL